MASAPKTTKTKTAETEVKTVPGEFVYEDNDSLYTEVMTTGAVAPTSTIPEPVSEYQFFPTSTPAPVPTGVVTRADASSIYLVEGKVRLDQDGSTPVFSDQRRIVNASNTDEALQKFVNYFTAMSNPLQRYTVVQAGASETIL